LVKGYTTGRTLLWGETLTPQVPAIRAARLHIATGLTATFKHPYQDEELSQCTFTPKIQSTTFEMVY
jgi:hypothetical protein